MAELIDPDTIASLREEGEGLLLDLIEIFQRETRERLKMLADGLERNDARQAERTAHTLKNSAAIVGALTMQTIAQEVERAARADDLATVRHLFDSLQLEVERARQALRAEHTTLTA